MLIMFDNKNKKECVKEYNLQCVCCGYSCDCSYIKKATKCEYYQEFTKGYQTIYYNNIGSLLVNIISIDIDMLLEQAYKTIQFKEIISVDDADKFYKWLSKFDEIKKQMTTETWKIISLLVLEPFYRKFSLFANDETKAKGVLMYFIKEIYMYFKCIKQYIYECTKDSSFYSIEKYLFAEKFFLTEDNVIDKGLDIIEIKLKDPFAKEKEYDIFFEDENEFIEELNKIYKKFKHEENENDEIFDEYYEIKDLKDFMKISLRKTLEAGYKFKICSNCGVPFIAYNRSDTIYCERVSPQDKTKTCKEYGARKTYQDNLKTYPEMGLYRKIYMQKQALSNRNPDIKEYLDDFEKFKIESKQWKKDVKNGIKTKEEYLAWLKSLRKKD